MEMNVLFNIDMDYLLLFGIFVENIKYKQCTRFKLDGVGRV